MKFIYKEFNRRNVLNRLFFLTFIILINIILLIFSVESSGQDWLKKAAILSILQLVINIFALIKFGEKPFSLPVLFLLFSWVFHFGNISIFGLNLSAKLTFTMLTQVPNYIVKDSVEYAFFVQSFVAFGMFLVLIIKKNDGDVMKAHGEDEKYLSFIRNLGAILILIGIIPTLYIDIGKIILFFSSGYVATYSLAQNGPLVILARVFKVGIFLLIIGYKNRPKTATILFLMIIFYQLLIMISGNRGQAVVEFIGLFYLYTNTIYKIRLKTIIPYGIIGYFLIVILNALSVFRLDKSPNFEDLMVAFTESLQTSPIILVLHEFGGTLITVCYSFLAFSGGDYIQYGTNYLFSLLTVFPNVMGIFDGIYTNAIYVENFPESFRTYIGGSYIGEIYFSFKQFGIPFALFIGIAISFFSRKINKAIVQKKYILLCIYMIIFPDTLWWIRGYFIDIVRYPIWISLVIFSVYSFLNGKSLSNKSIKQIWN